jgi:lipopolysaccharide export LptBFGC system permease protein LptF
VEPLIHGSRDQTFQQLFAEELKKKEEEHQAKMQAAMKKKENEHQAAMKKKEEEHQAEMQAAVKKKEEEFEAEREMWNKKEQELNESLANAQKELADDRETIDKLSLKTLVTNGVPPPKACGSGAQFGQTGPRRCTLGIAAAFISTN